VPMHARDNVHRATGWIKACSQHRACAAFVRSNPEPQARPTRILEITGERTVRLRTAVFKEPYDYLALSHMWGQDHEKQIRLLEHNVEGFQTEVPWANLSDIYREGIRITLALGFRYIWIDSLCIVQDSESDWAYESKRMAVIYGNSTCNIAFLFPSHHVLPPREDPRIWNPCILRRVTRKRCGVYMRHLVDSWRQTFPEEKQDWLVQRNWPLFNRAWTFQEYLLAPRTLLVGHKNLMFQCSHHFYDELLGPVGTSTRDGPRGRDLGKRRYFPDELAFIREKEARYPATTIENVLASSIDKLPSTTDRSWAIRRANDLRVALDWINLVNEYLHRTLSFPSDRVVAFAGIATAYNRLSNMTYLAGLWFELLPLSLLWAVKKKPAALIRRQYPDIVPRGVEPVYSFERKEDGVSTAPTWSWFHVPIWKFWCVSCVFHGDEGSIMVRSLKEPGRSNSIDVQWAQPISFYFSSEQRGENWFPVAGFSGFDGLRVKIETLTWPVSRDLPADLATQFRRVESLDSLELEWDPAFEYYPDSPSSSTSPSPPRHGIFALLNQSQIVRTAGTYHVQRRMAGLVLVPDTHEGYWKRLGAWSLKIRIKGMEVVEGRVAEIAERWRAYSLTSNWEEQCLTLV
jgi:hypothetical protein